MAEWGERTKGSRPLGKNSSYQPNDRITSENGAGRLLHHRRRCGRRSRPVAEAITLPGGRSSIFVNTRRRSDDPRWFRGPIVDPPRRRRHSMHR